MDGTLLSCLYTVIVEKLFTSKSYVNCLLSSALAIETILAPIFLHGPIISRND